MSSDATFDKRERAVAEERERQHRRGRPRLPPDERRDEERAGDERHDDARARPTVLVAAHEAPDDAEQAGADECEAGQVERRVGAVRLLEPRVRERSEHEPDRDVEPEDPVPREAADDSAADERADRDREAADAAPDAEREPAPGGAEQPAERIVSVSGATIAPPTPWTARAMSSWFAVVASAAPADAAVKSRSPMTNMRRRPKRSPSAAPVSRSTANVSVYAFTVHSSCEIVAWRSCRITGSAVVTTRLSSETMNSATDVIASVQIIECLRL